VRAKVSVTQLEQMTILCEMVILMQMEEARNDNQQGGGRNHARDKEQHGGQV